MHLPPTPLAFSRPNATLKRYLVSRGPPLESNERYNRAEQKQNRVARLRNSAGDREFQIVVIRPKFHMGRAELRNLPQP
jgi:hypothetical protein